MLFGAPDNEAAKLQLKRDPNFYHFLRQGGVAKVDSISDRTDYKNVAAAFRALNFDTANVETIWKIVAAVLHLVLVKNIFFCFGLTFLKMDYIPFVVGQCGIQIRRRQDSIGQRQHSGHCVVPFGCRSE